MANFLTRSEYDYMQLSWLKKYLWGHRGYIAGGCFKNIFNGQHVKDLDIFFNNQFDFDKAKAFFQKRIEADERKNANDKKWIFSYENSNVWSVKDIKNNVRLELIQSHFGTPSELLATFDFTITKMAYYSVDSQEASENQDFNFDGKDQSGDFKILMSSLFFENLQTKRLVIDNERILYPLSTLNRSLKYSGYGYKMCHNSKLKLARSLAELSVKKIDDDALSNSFYAGID